MTNVPENVDPETGEVLEEPTATVDFGNGPIDMDDKQAMAQGAEGFVSKLMPEAADQLRLFEGHRVDLLKLKLKSATIAETILASIKDIDQVPRYRDTRYFVIEANVCSAAHKPQGEDAMLQKTATFEIDKIRFLDEITAKRLLKDRDEA